MTFFKLAEALFDVKLKKYRAIPSKSRGNSGFLRGEFVVI